MRNRDPLLGIFVDDRYELVERVGRGAFGAVYRARHTRLGVPVAVKFLSATLAGDDTNLARFEREARTTARIRHPNVVGTLDFGELPGVGWYIVSEFVDGGTLQDRLEEAGRLPVTEAVAITAQVCDALAAAHAMGVVHRDLKPANVMLERHGDALRVRLVDFGIAGLMDDSQKDLTASNACVGSPNYMAPEVALGERAGPAADQYSLGVVLFRMLTGRLPFEAANGPAMLAAHCTETPPAPGAVCAGAEVPPALDAVVARTLEKEPEDRFESVAALRSALVALGTAAAEETAPLPTRVGHRRPEPPRRRLPIAGVGAAGAAIGALALHLVGPLLTGAELDVPRPPDLALCRSAGAPTAASAASATVAEESATPPVALELRTMHRAVGEAAAAWLPDALVTDSGGGVVRRAAERSAQEGAVATRSAAEPRLRPRGTEAKRPARKSPRRRDPYADL